MRHTRVNHGPSNSQLSYPGDKPAQTLIQVKEEAKFSKEVFDLECCVQPEPGYCEVSSVTNCDEDPETSFGKKTSGMINGISAPTPCSYLKIESSNPAIINLRSMRSPDQLRQHVHSRNVRKSPIGAESFKTPERYFIGDTYDITPEADASFDMSVSSQGNMKTPTFKLSANKIHPLSVSECFQDVKAFGYGQK